MVHMNGGGQRGSRSCEGVKNGMRDERAAFNRGMQMKYYILVYAGQPPG